MARKTGKELRKEYRNLLDKTKAMQKRLVKRAEELIPQYPDVVYIKDSFPDGKPITVGQYKNGYRIDPMIALSIIELIEAHIASQHPHKQGKLFNGNVEVVPAPPVGERVLVNGKTGEAFIKNPEQKDLFPGHKTSENSVRIANPETKDKRFVVSEIIPFTEYQDEGDGYKPPRRKIENEVLEIRLYCSHENCNTYIKGKEGYNGAFEAETGQYCDLRNQGFNCKKHC